MHASEACNIHTEMFSICVTLWKNSLNDFVQQEAGPIEKSNCYWLYSMPQAVLHILNV